MPAQIKDSCAVVTGAGSGIGRATAIALARAGARVACLDLDGRTAADTAAACDGLASGATSMVLDVGDYDAFAAAADSIEADLGPADVVVNNAGVGLAGPFAEHTIEDWRWLRRVNLDGMIHGSHIYAGRMAARGRGHIVNLASMAGYMPHASMAAYCTSKAAVIMFSSCLRQELRASGVGVSAICPGVIDTPIPSNTRLVGAMAGKRDRAVRTFRHGHPPEAVAKAILGAIEHDRELVPVGFESHFAYRALRHLPRPARGFLARLPLG